MTAKAPLATTSLVSEQQQSMPMPVLVCSTTFVELLRTSVFYTLWGRMKCQEQTPHPTTRYSNTIRLTQFPSTHLNCGGVGPSLANHQSNQKQIIHDASTAPHSTCTPPTRRASKSACRWGWWCCNEAPISTTIEPKVVEIWQLNYQELPDSPPVELQRVVIPY
eukprot:4722059-Amphidinium_carterae.1